MKNRILILVLILISQLSFAQKVDVYDRPVQRERSHNFDALHYRVSIDVDLEKNYLKGENQITISPFNNGFNKCSLDAESLIVEKVTGQNGQSLKFDQKNDKVNIQFDKDYRHTDTLQFTVEYYLDTPVLGLRFQEASKTNPKVVSSDCFPNKSRQWIPLYDYPHDKATNEMLVTVNKKYKVLSNGRLVGVTKNDKEGTHTWHWSQGLPHSTYLISLSIGDFAVIKDSLGDLPINYWVYDFHLEDAQNSFRKTPQMIEFFNKIYDYEYPWEKYDQVIAPYMGGGAEATSATILGEGAVTDKSAILDFSYERVIAHEIAHQWWGDLITCREWSHTWLNESFGTYSDYLYTRNEYGEDAGAYDLLGKKNQYLREAKNRYMRPIVFNRYNSPGDNFDSHTYPKGANVLHLLRYILGDDTFFRTISTFLHKYEFQPVDTYDLMKTVKEVSGRNMDWFFEQFVFKPGHAAFEVSKSWDESNKTLKVDITQNQDVNPKVPIYIIPVNLGFTVDGKKTVEEVWLHKKNETYEFKFDKEPEMVRFDEGNYLTKELAFEKPLKELIYQANNDDVIGRLWAVEQLDVFGADQKTIDCWLKRLNEDTFWAVRKAAMDKIGKYASEDHLDMIKASLDDEKSNVRQSAVRILGDQKDKKYLKLMKKVYESDPSYIVQAEAIRSIGKCGGIGQIEYIKKAASRNTHRSTVERAASDIMSKLLN